MRATDSPQVARAVLPRLSHRQRTPERTTEALQHLQAPDASCGPRGHHGYAGMTWNKQRGLQLTTVALYELDRACELIFRAFDGPPYLVGTAGDGKADGYRDVDVRLILGDDEFAAACPTRARWELLCRSIGAYLHDRTGLPIDFQIQRATEANERYGRGTGSVRNALGMKRIFAGGGDGVPAWVAPTVTSEGDD